MPIIQARLTAAAKTVDTCGVLYLHGLPGLLGGLTALFVVSGIDFAAQMTAMLVTVVIAAVTGLLSGKVLAVLGRRIAPYVDSEEFEGEEGEEKEVQPCSAAAESIA